MSSSSAERGLGALVGLDSSLRGAHGVSSLRSVQAASTACAAVPVVMYSTAFWRLNSEAGPLTDQLAQVQDRDPVGHLEDVVEVVRDHADRDAAAGERLIRSSTISRLGDAERGGRLVHDHQLGVANQRLGDGDRLTLPAGQRGDRLADRAHSRDTAGRSTSRRAAISIASSSSSGASQQLVPEEHVLDDVQVVAEREVLVDRLDAERLGITRAVEVDRLAVPEDLAAIRRPEASDRLDQSTTCRRRCPRSAP